MVCMRFLVSVQPFFTFSGYLMSIIKRPLRVHFFKEASKVMYFVCEFGLLLVELEKRPLRNEVTLGLDC